MVDKYFIFYLFPFKEIYEIDADSHIV